MSSENRSSAIAERFESIRRARRIRWLGIGLLVLVGLYLFVNALQVVKFFDANLANYLPNFVEALEDFFPITTYFGAIPFLDLGAYGSYIRAEKLLYDPSAAPTLADPGSFVTLFTQSGGPFALFGEAGLTLAMGVAGTIIGFPLALLFGVLGSGRVTPFPFNFLFRGVMSAIRSIPALVWALIYVPLAGLGPVTATLAIGTDTVGNLGRLFTDELEEVEDGPIEAMRTTGANRPQTIVFGMLSQVHTSFIAWTLYIFEINVRLAVTLGIIGGGGLGQKLKVQQGLFKFTNMMAVILVILLLIVTVEVISQRVRAHLRADEQTTGIFELLAGVPRRFSESLLK